ncbi:UVR domain-containing protein, partial [Durusdinium trenchii]
VLTVNPSLVTCLKLQHRAAPTERNLVSALRVASGDWRADPNLTVDEGCVVLGDAGNVMAKRGEALHPQRTALLDLEVVLLHQSGARDFPRNFRSQLLKGLFPKGTSKTWTQLAMPRALASLLLWLVRQKKGLSIHASISLLGHFWDTRALTRALEKIPGTARDYRACGFRGKVKVIYQVGDLLFKREVVLIGFQIGFQISPQPAGLE